MFTSGNSESLRNLPQISKLMVDSVGIQSQIILIQSIYFFHHYEYREFSFTIIIIAGCMSTIINENKGTKIEIHTNK